ncbi:thiol-disulfide oxidoreductase DCC family protein [Deinococcus yavapaiensis]|uniref:Putative DCC family thiol-disulfide oxidoreductase YuxK n=1 Tax=Deinococcus yavapaiensis KR-236 TaxID=694435 RepID=A0A318SH15_9DEIO|nr:thiol-disulfide oxidoreductase DCC family protein [Deinococcus yavapaiensis]PYE56395.1 putative DCC family thiol-disulfide oxidoreductase YuxK [Deinococcus yavapaiensis KR-236]
MNRVVLFDGMCNLCSASVQLVIRHDPRGMFRFASQQSAVGRDLMRTHGLSDELRTVVLIEGGAVYLESDAAVGIAREMGWPWKLAWSLRFVPRFLRDAVYRFVARHRYVLFGKKNACWLPTPELRARFLDA